ncbi:MAG: hypothetical protein ACR2JB_18235 [Bryobacteraceae bacterium]
MSPLPQVDPPCATIVYRQVRRASWYDADDDSKVMAEAFMRRRPKIRADGSYDPGDEDGLSVYDSFRIDRQACIEDCNSCQGLATLHVGTLRNLDLNVVRDAEDYRKILVTNMPLENPNDPQQELLAETVARSAKIALRQKWKRPT